MTRKEQIILPILHWYKKNKRDLPWRRTMRPYHILVSEVMLQQTQVDRVIIKYREFLRYFPSIKQLGNASPGEVITAWKGLGYNRRALYLQKTAQAIRQEYGGRFPQDIDTLMTLPGIGNYTARAILSFAFDKPVAMMDTNHRKFYSRIFFQENGQSDKILLEKTKDLVADLLTLPSLFSDKKSMVYHWNQALMDFGAHFLARGTHLQDCPIKQFDQLFPDQVKKQQKKAHTPFRQTNRYYRGRIVDALRSEKSITIKTIAKLCADIPKKRQQTIIQGLIKDGLIKQAGCSMLLP